MQNVGRTSLRSSGTIMDGNIVKGYFFFYFSARAEKKMSIYEIVILDENLKEIASEQFKESKATYLLESSYNGSKIMFKFFDAKNRQVIYLPMDMKGNIGDKTTREAGKQELAGYNASVSQNMENVSLNAANSKNFVDLYLVKDKGYKYVMEGVSNSGNSDFEYTPEPKKGVTAGTFLTSNDDMIIIAEATSKSIMSRDYKFQLAAIDYDGENIFQIELQNSRYNMLPYNAFIDEKTGDIVVLGEYFDINDKAAKAESKGIFVKRITKDGDEEDEQFISWTRDVGKQIPAALKKEVAKHSVCFHDIRVTKDGKIIVVGELYKKQVSAGGIALQALASASGNVSTNSGSFEIKIGHMLVLTLDANAELQSVDVLEKKPNRVNLPQGYGMVSQHLMARYLKSYGAFDYEYTQNNEDNSLISIAYKDLEKNKGSKMRREYVLNVVNFNAGEEDPTKDKLSLETEASDLIVLPAKPGHALIAEYFRKSKTIELRLEPLNF